MIPRDFKEANANLQRPYGMTDEECGPLPALRDGRVCLSCWRMSWKERLAALFFGRVWLYVHSGHTQPPVYLEAKRTPFDGGH